MSKKFIGTVISALLFVSAGQAQAQVQGPTWPPPGGVTFATAGGPSAGDPGGLDLIFTGFDPSAFTVLYWGPQDAEAVQAGLNGAPGTVLDFESISGVTATWSGVTQYVVPPPGSGTLTVPVVLDITVAGLGTDPWIPSTSVPGLDPGVGTGIGAVVDNSSGSDFTATLEFKADVGSGLVALNTVPQFPQGVLTVSSFNGGIFFGTAPVASCTESVNPAGKKIPPAGATTLPGSKGGQNEDGFYLIEGMDTEDGLVDVFVTSASGSATFGPFPSGTTVKITEAPGATPSAKLMGGPDSAVAAHIKLDSDALVVAVDSLGDLSEAVSCLLPPAPK